jgi:inosine/xanthosine triphosphatase
MILNIGSKNHVKINALKEIISNYDFLSNAEVIGIDSNSNVSDQPKTLEETILGAKNRARGAFIDCDYSFGIEDGLMKVNDAKTGYMNVCVCAIFDGEKYHIGLSSAFEYPEEAIKLVFEEGLDINQAFYKIGLTDNPKVGSSDGAISILTKGRLVRKDCVKQALMMALIHLENKI